MRKGLFFISIVAVIISLLSFVSCKNENRKGDVVDHQKVSMNYFKGYSDAQLFSGKLMRMDSFSSKFIKSRPVDVWLPESYSESNKYSVLYMHDGQMLFDSTSTWNKQEWKVDEWASKLMNEGKTKNFVVVAIHNIPEIRWQDLFPQKAAAHLSEAVLDSIRTMKSSHDNMVKLNGDNYLKFMVQELKPIIDKEFSVYADKAHTFVMGSSMGGLMSMYAICEYPNVFEGAACMSTHWPGVTPVGNFPLPEAIFKYLEENLPPAYNHKIYFDFGTETLDAHYPKYEATVNQIMEAGGYTSQNFENLKFDGTNHSENAWNKRLDSPLHFLLAKK